MGEKHLQLDAKELHRLTVQYERGRSTIVFEATADRGPGGVSCQNCSAEMPRVADLVTM